MSLNHLLRDLILTLFIGFLFRLITGVPIKHIPEEAFLDFTIFVTSATVVLSFRLSHLWGIIKKLLSFLEQTETKFRKPAIEFLRKGIYVLSERIPSIFSLGGFDLSILEVDLISQLCFQFGNGIYNGTDSNTPSEFKRKYTQFLSYQEENLKKKSKPGIRILLVSEKSLQDDFRIFSDEFKSFRDWHSDNSIELLQVDPAKATELAKQHHTPENATDIGIWDSHYVAVFKPNTDTIRLIMRTNGSDDFRNCKNYFIELINHTKDITIHSGNLYLQDRSSSQKQEDIKKVTSQWTE
jgi:hypothetical protein